MPERSIELIKQSINGTNKYDYFIVGIGAATFSYFAKDFKVSEHFYFNESTVILLALILLSISVICGLKTISLYNIYLNKNGKYLDLSEHLAGYKKNVIEGGIAINEENGDILYPDESELKVRALSKILPERKNELHKLGNKIEVGYRIRDYSLFISYIFLAISKSMPLFINLIPYN
ncbi:hypothetical protein IIDPJIOB_03591 [Aeromonas veronii]|uniref:hypothetical protein n=1 Tax=Aeromonas veronii TaxID=654 RepID=UPI00366FD416